ncbi:MAG: hypothetical protein R3B09_29840 [Nannocystaceae bacterium]
MSRAARSVQVFALYLAGAGLWLVVDPESMLDLVGMPVSDDVYVRLVGMMMGVLAVYYTAAARAELTRFLTWTVPLRMAVLPTFVGFVIAGLAPPALVTFGIADLAGALWTRAALRRDPDGR